MSYKGSASGSIPGIEGLRKAATFGNSLPMTVLDSMDSSDLGCKGISYGLLLWALVDSGGASQEGSCQDGSLLSRTYLVYSLKLPLIALR